MKVMTNFDINSESLEEKKVNEYYYVKCWSLKDHFSTQKGLESGDKVA